MFISIEEKVQGLKLLFVCKQPPSDPQGAGGALRTVGFDPENKNKSNT